MTTTEEGKTDDFPSATDTRRIASEARKPLPPSILSKIAELINESASIGSDEIMYFPPKDEVEFQEVIVAFLREKHYGAVFIDVGDGKPHITIHW